MAGVNGSDGRFVTAGRSLRFDETLHPRGHGGQFAEKLNPDPGVLDLAQEPEPELSWYPDTESNYQPAPTQQDNPAGRILAARQQSDDSRYTGGTIDSPVRPKVEQPTAPHHAETAERDFERRWWRKAAIFTIGGMGAFVAGTGVVAGSVYSIACSAEAFAFGSAAGAISVSGAWLANKLINRGR